MPLKLLKHVLEDAYAVFEITHMRELYFFININIFVHLKLIIALAIQLRPVNGGVAINLQSVFNP